MGVSLYIVLFSVVFVVSVLGYGRFRHILPNGWGVPHPCPGRGRWNAVGHMNVEHVRDKNLFGEDARTTKRGRDIVWNEWLCRQDSDGDGLTNGEELGDPNCRWQRGQGGQGGQTPGPVRGHPGFCEPGRQKCKSERASHPECLFTGRFTQGQASMGPPKRAPPGSGDHPQTLLSKGFGGQTGFGLQGSGRQGFPSTTGFGGQSGFGGQGGAQPGFPSTTGFGGQSGFGGQGGAQPGFPSTTGFGGQSGFGGQGGAQPGFPSTTGFGGQSGFGGQGGAQPGFPSTTGFGGQSGFGGQGGAQPGFPSTTGMSGAGTFGGSGQGSMFTPGGVRRGRGAAVRGFGMTVPGMAGAGTAASTGSGFWAPSTAGTGASRSSGFETFGTGSPMRYVVPGGASHGSRMTGGTPPTGMFADSAASTGMSSRHAAFMGGPPISGGFMGAAGGMTAGGAGMAGTFGAGSLDRRGSIQRLIRERMRLARMGQRPFRSDVGSASGGVRIPIIDGMLSPGMATGSMGGGAFTVGGAGGPETPFFMADRHFSHRTGTGAGAF